MRMEGGKAMTEKAVNPYWGLRLWNKAKEQFSNIRGEEDLYGHNLLCIEQQVFLIAGKYNKISDEDIMLALAICGLKVAAALEKKEGQIEFKDISMEVEELANCIMATFHPNYNSELTAVIKNMWQTIDDEMYHYRTAGSVLRRLTDSCKFWTKSGGSKGYVKYVTSFLVESNLIPKDDRVNFAIGTKSVPTGLENKF